MRTSLPPKASSGNPVDARNAFLTRLTGVGNEDFEGFTRLTPAPIDLSFAGSSGGIGATLSGDGVILDSEYLGRFATSGSNYLYVPGEFNLSFTAPISAFGSYATDIGDYNGQVTLMLTRTDGTTSDLTIPNTVNGPDASLLFYGFIDPDESYTAIRLGNTAAGDDSFGFDDMVIGDIEQIVPTTPSVPEPGVLALLGIAALGLALRRRKV